jgi:excisionase family DNA binding protein
MEREGYSVMEFAKMFGLGKSFAYAAVREKRIKSHRLGNKIIICKSDIEDWKNEGKE